ncbi:MAG TPA: hydroxyacid dehydrogenase [Bacteroidetes bacterium]|nr:hydroxyacid dehydrogenase [Bacteroidota bacterium]
MDIYFYEAFEEETASLKVLIGNEFTFEMTKETIQESGHFNPPARLISIRTQSLIPAPWADKLDGVLSRSTGYDHLKQFLKTIHTPLPCGFLNEYATRAVAEQAILMSMALLRRLPQQMQQFEHFNRDGLTGNELSGKNLLVVGVGRIGKEILSLGSALGMNIRGVDHHRKHSAIHYVTKEEGISWADIIVCAMDLTDENHGYFSYDVLKRAKPGVIFINIARGEHTPTKDLKKLLLENHLGGLGLDVYEDEPNIAASFRGNRKSESHSFIALKEILHHPRVIFTPHNAFNTVEAVYRKSQYTVNEIRYFLKNNIFQTRLEL